MAASAATAPSPTPAPAATRDTKDAAATRDTKEGAVNRESIEPEPAEAETRLLPATKWRAQRPPSTRDGVDPTASEPESRRRHRSRRRDDDDDFGDFTYLRDPTDTDPGGSTGRRSR
jgi:hypothetical protein